MAITPPSSTADFGTLGLWMWNAGAWSQVSPLNPD